MLFRLILAVGVGSIYVLGYAPFEFWFLSLAAVFALLALLHNQTKWRGFLIGWVFGIGLFGSGATWIYHSLFVYGDMHSEVATLITVLFCLFMALFYGAFGYSYCLVNYHRHSIFSSLNIPIAFQIASFASLWTLFELLRSHIYVGFPWLLLGNALVDTPLAHWAPIGGSFVVSFLCLLTIACLFHLLLLLPTIYVIRNQSKAFILLLVALAPWAIGFRLQFYQWTAPSAPSTSPAHSYQAINLAVIQANIPQDIKWDDREFAAINEIYHRMTREQTNTDLIIWPEAAIPHVYKENDGFYDPIDAFSRQNNTTLLFGSLRLEPNDKVYNSILMAGARLDRPQPIYDKKILVPFGEYIPLESYLSRWLAFFNLSIHSITPGTNSLSPQISGWQVAPSICYEITRGQYIARLARGSHFLVTLSNDSWFGDTLGPHQHMHLARMRALENQRYLIRSTNNGITALVAPNGKIVAQLPQFQRRILTAEFYPHQGTTPYQMVGDMPIALISLAFSLLSLLIYRRNINRV